MKRSPLLLAVLALATLANADSLRAHIESVNQKTHVALMKKDIKGFILAHKDGIAKDFKYTEDSRTLNFRQMAAGIQGGFAQIAKMISERTNLVDLKQTGETARATSHHTMTALTLGAKHSTHKMVFNGVSVETYRKENGKWLMDSMSWKSQKMTLDGKAL